MLFLRIEKSSLIDPLPLMFVNCEQSNLLDFTRRIRYINEDSLGNHCAETNKILGSKLFAG
jgi:hypothetical protein